MNKIFIDSKVRLALSRNVNLILQDSHNFQLASLPSLKPGSTELKRSSKFLRPQVRGLIVKEGTNHNLNQGLMFLVASLGNKLETNFLLLLPTEGNILVDHVNKFICRVKSPREPSGPRACYLDNQKIPGSHPAWAIYFLYLQQNALFPE